MRIHLVTHNDLDGMGNLVILKYLLNKDIELTFDIVGNSNVDTKVLDVLERMNEIDLLFITDLSTSESVAEELNKHSNKVRLVDHHKTAEWMNKYEWASVRSHINNVPYSGTFLFNEFIQRKYKSIIDIELINDSYKRFVSLVDNYDTWKWKDLPKVFGTESKMLNDLLRIKGNEDFIMDILNSISNNRGLFSKFDMRVLQYKEEEINSYINKKEKQVEIREIDGIKYGIVVADQYVSELGNEICERKMNEIDAALIITGDSISLRSVKENIDVSIIAKKFGGGGHKPAAGFGLNGDMKNTLLDNIVDVLSK